MDHFHLTAHAFFETYSPSEAVRQAVLAIRPILEALECTIELPSAKPLPVDEYVKVYERRRSMHAQFGKDQTVAAFDELLTELKQIRGVLGTAGLDTSGFSVTMWVAERQIVAVLVLPAGHLIALEPPTGLQQGK